MDMAPDRDQPRSMSQKDKETIKEYAQRWRELAAQIRPPLEEKEMTKIFLKTLSSFYYEHMIASAPNDFTEMVNMGMRLEEGVCEGRLSKDEALTSKKYGGSLSKKKEGETNAVSVERQRRPNGASGHDIENCHPLKYEVQKLVKNGMVSFEDRAPNVKANQLPAHGNASVNMVDGCPGNFRVFDVRRICRSLVEMPKTMCLVSDCEHDHDGCVICGVNPCGCIIVKRDIQKLMDENVIQIQQSRDMGEDVNVIVSVFKTPEQYNGTMIKNGQEVPLPVADSVVNIVYITRVTRSGGVFSQVFPKIVEDVSVGKKAEIPVVDPVSAPMCQSGESSKLKTNDDDEVLRLIKRSEFNIVEQLLQTPSKIYVMSLLMNYEAHKEAL
ncbi:hypothetical protein KIW84_013370 [Lathyrus oleraceus]|uniref:Retrotransposon gag domain-containing protein n=1 Tax=Pisum sativum TaxID=3888 RepID=A0A9D5BJV6_PEA|nr:hypothetical protein KIW84_013370 [Pisum sativum]